MADPDRNFDAIVIGSNERAFYGNQFAIMAPFNHYGIEAYMPELGSAAAEPQTAGQQELTTLLGIPSKREIARARIRTRSATPPALPERRGLGQWAHPHQPDHPARPHRP
ncbi:hypothetical protein [Streptomyces sp. NPDC046759]|uniref:hypothetical protein n=1 Tax=Streptomyces sp. NPDC046759 TaxID=3155019 RepID=UPI0033D3665E